MLKLTINLLWVTLPFLCFSQDGIFNFGARDAGLAGASVAVADLYSLFNNVGNLGSIENHGMVLGYQSRYHVAAFQVVGAGAIYVSPVGIGGIGFFKFGDETFSQQRIHLAFGHKIQLISLGFGLDVLQYRISTVGTQHALAIQFGGVVELSSKWRFGAHVFNLNQAQLDRETNEPIPTVMKAGFSYLPTNELMLNVEIEKDLDFEELFKVGLEYQLIKHVFLRTGINSAPFLSAFGLGFHPKRLSIDYSYANHARLGSTHELSIGYVYK